MKNNPLPPCVDAVRLIDLLPNGGGNIFSNAFRVGEQVVARVKVSSWQIAGNS